MATSSACDNIRVAVRIRPLIEREKNLRVIWSNRENTIHMISGQNEKRYYFDHVFGMDHSTQDIYEEFVKPIVTGVMSGYHGTVFAYGQTSSGKTHTMTGDDGNPGIIYLAIAEMFKLVDEMHSKEFLFSVAYMEIYKDKLQDLLAGDSGAPLKFREKKSGEVYVENLSEHYLNHPQAFIDKLQEGEGRRRTAATHMNARSSRSHAIFTIKVESTGKSSDEAGAVTVACLNLVDLAGSEHLSQTGGGGDRARETAAINKSLHFLTHVIYELSCKRVPCCRNSNLTFVLRNALGGNAKTAIICNVTPAYRDETKSTLEFARRAKRITNKPVLNKILSKDAQLKRCKEEIDRLQQELEEVRGGGSVQEEEDAATAATEAALEGDIERRLCEEMSEKETRYKRRILALETLLCVTGRLRSTQQPRSVSTSTCATERNGKLTLETNLVELSAAQWAETFSPSRDRRTPQLAVPVVVVSEAEDMVGSGADLAALNHPAAGDTGDTAAPDATAYGGMTAPPTSTSTDTLHKEKVHLEQRVSELSQQLAEEKEKEKEKSLIAEVEERLRKEQQLNDVKEQLNETRIQCEELQQLLAKKDEDLTRALTKCDEETASRSSAMKAMREMENKVIELEEGLEAEKAVRGKVEKQKRDLGEELEAELGNTSAQQDLRQKREEELMSLKKVLEQEAHNHEIQVQELKHEHNQAVETVNEQLDTLKKNIGNGDPTKNSNRHGPGVIELGSSVILVRVLVLWLKELEQNNTALQLAESKSIQLGKTVADGQQSVAEEVKLKLDAQSKLRQVVGERDVLQKQMASLQQQISEYHTKKADEENNLIEQMEETKKESMSALRCVIL